MPGDTQASNPQQEGLASEDQAIDLNLEMVSAGIVLAGREVSEGLALGQPQDCPRSQADFAKLEDLGRRDSGGLDVVHHVVDGELLGLAGRGGQGEGKLKHLFDFESG